ncbi:MAG: alpha/beta hydrolase [Phormidesmis sp.]
MTHFVPPGQVGIGLPRPYSENLPSDRNLNYVTHRIPINTQEWLEAWFIPAEATPKGTVLLFHGKGGTKASQLLPSAQAIHELGYSTWLVDFRGVGGSSGQTSTLGIRESEDVAISLAYAQDFAPNPPFVLYGISLGSVAVLKAASAGTVDADALIVEQPFHSMVNAVRKRVAATKVPTFPLAELIVFWGSVQHGFNGFSHNPVHDAAQVSIPTLLLQGEKDQWTTMSEIKQIFDNLQGEKQLTTFPTAEHNLLISVDKEMWETSVRTWLKEISP